MTPPNFDRLFTEFNARQMRADRAADRIYSWLLIAGIVFASFCMAVVLSLGVQ
jgi:hypothetical protein